MKDIVQFGSVKECILTIRDQQVILDSDVAKLYDVETKRVNEAVKNNPDKFPEGYSIPNTFLKHLQRKVYICSRQSSKVQRLRRLP